MAATLGGVRGTVTVGMIPTFTAFDVVDVLRTYRAAYPDATVRLRSGASETLIEDVRTGTVDLALLGVPDGFSTAGVVARRLAVDHLVLVVPEAERVDGPSPSPRPPTARSPTTLRAAPAARNPTRHSSAPACGAPSPSKWTGPRPCSN